MVSFAVYVLILLVLSISFIIIYSVNASNNKNHVARMMDAVVAITVTTNNQLQNQFKPVVHEGTGFFIDKKEGYILTAAHVVTQDVFAIIDVDESITNDVVIYVTSTDHKVRKASIVGIDHRADVAILHVCGPPPSVVVSMYKHPDVKAGDTCFTIGNAFGMDKFSVSFGHVRNPSWKDPWSQLLLPCILTDISTSPGTSGSPIFKQDGTFIGIHLAALHPVPPKGLSRTIEEEKTEEEPVPTEEVGGGDTIEIGTADNEEASPPPTGGLNVGSSNDLDEVINMGDTTIPTSTTFGGGLTVDVLIPIVHHIISEYEKNNREQILSTSKSFLQCSFLPNTIDNRIKLKYDDMNSDDNGYIVVSLDGDVDSIDGLEKNDCILAINDIPIGYSVDHKSPSEITWHMHDNEIVNLLVRKYDTKGIVQLSHVVSKLPKELDYPLGTLQANSHSNSDFFNYKYFIALKKKSFDIIYVHIQPYIEERYVLASGIIWTKKPDNTYDTFTLGNGMDYIGDIAFYFPQLLDYLKNVYGEQGSGEDDAYYLCMRTTKKTEHVSVEDWKPYYSSTQK